MHTYGEETKGFGLLAYHFPEFKYWTALLERPNQALRPYCSYTFEIHVTFQIYDLAVLPRKPALYDLSKIKW